MKKLKKLKIKVKKDYDENNENYNEENNDYQEVDNDYDEDKPIKRKKKRGPKGEGKVKVSYILILRRSLGGFWEVLRGFWEHFGKIKIIMMKTNPSNIKRKEVLRELRRQS